MTKYCSKCGQPIDDNAKYCPKCGASNVHSSLNQHTNTPMPSNYSRPTQQFRPNYVIVQPPANNQNRRSRGLALVLCFFCGFLGIHQFYLGNSTKGFLYLIGAITCVGVIVTGILSLVDFFIILCMSENEFNERYSF